MLILLINQINPLPPSVFFVTRPPKGRLLQPPPGIFYTERLIPLYLLPVYSYGPPLPIDTKMSTIKLHMTSLWHHKVISAPSEIWMHWKCTWKWAKINFSLKKIVETWDFRRTSVWICKKMMILIYIERLKHISCQIFKKWKKKVMGFHPPLPILFDDPYPNDTPKCHLIYIIYMRKGCINDYIEAFGAVHWAKKLFKKTLSGLQQPPPLGERGLNTISCWIHIKNVTTVVMMLTMTLHDCMTGAELVGFPSADGVLLCLEPESEVGPVYWQVSRSVSERHVPKLQLPVSQAHALPSNGSAVRLYRCA